MSISIACPKCGKTYDVPESRAGHTGNCSCGAVISVPESPSGAAAPAQAVVGPPTVLRRPIELAKCPACNTVLPPRTDICTRCGTNRLTPPPPAPTIPEPVAPAMTPPSAYPPPAPGYSPPPRYEDPAVASARLLVHGRFASGRPMALTVVLTIAAILAVILLAGTVVSAAAPSPDLADVTAQDKSADSLWTVFVIALELGFLAVLWFVWVGQGWARTVLLILSVLLMLNSMIPAFLRGSLVSWLILGALAAVVVVLISPSTHEWCAE